MKCMFGRYRYKYVIVIALHIALKCIPSTCIYKMVCQKAPKLFSVRRKHWNEIIRPLPHFRPLPNDGRLDGGRETSIFLGHFLSLQRYQNLPTPTAGIPFARLDPYLVPPDGLYGGPKSLPDGGESSLISGELSSTLQMGKSSSPFMCRTRPIGSGYSQHKTRCMQSVIMQFYLDEGCCVYRNPLFWVCLHPQEFVPAVKECVCVVQVLQFPHNQKSRQEWPFKQTALHSPMCAHRYKPHLPSCE